MVSKMMNLIKEELNYSSIFIDESKLNLDFIPERLIHRDEEFRLLSRIFIPLLKNDNYIKKNVIITGNNGTGKTALSKRFGISIVEIAQDFGKKIRYIHVNCRLKKTNYNILKSIVKTFRPNFPERGFSLYELITILKKILSQNDYYLIIALDELNFLDLKSDNLIYLLNRINDDDIDEQSRISIIGIEKNLNFIKHLDLGTLSSFKYNIISLKPYSKEEIFDILLFRSNLAIKKIAVNDEILHFISTIAAKNGDMRYALEILYKAGKYADKKKIKEITPECIRYARTYTFENFDLESLYHLTLNEKLILLGICRALKRTSLISIDFKQFKQSYNLVCEELGFEPIKKTQLYSLVSRLRFLEFIFVNNPTSKKSGESSTIGIDSIPVEVLEQELLKLL
ncbi:MAG: Cdc6/Cdc18 family protein [Promethearchaeota archaeon]